MMSKDKLKTQEEIKTWLKEALIRSATTQSELADSVGISR
jgi:DNA-binding XRE family transcriptional regulator